jgi:hypothetical protein
MERVYHQVSILRNKLFCSSASSSSSSAAASNRRRHRRTTTKTVRRMDPMIRSALVTTIQEEMKISSTPKANGDVNHNVNTHTNDIHNSNNMNMSIPTTLQEMEHELQVVQEQLEMAIHKEQFISQRSHTYQKLLDEQAYRMKQQQQQQQQQQVEEDDVDDDDDDDDDDDIEAGWKNDTKEVDDEEEESKNPLVATVTTTNDTTSVTGTSTTRSAATNVTTPNLEFEQRQQKWERNMEALEAIRGIHLQILTRIETLRRQLRKLQQQKQSMERMYDECTTFVDVAVAATAANEDDLNPTTEAITTTTSTTTAHSNDVRPTTSIRNDDDDQDSNMERSAAADASFIIHL